MLIRIVAQITLRYLTSSYGAITMCPGVAQVLSCAGGNKLQWCSSNTGSDYHPQGPKYMKSSNTSSARELSILQSLSTVGRFTVCALGMQRSARDAGHSRMVAKPRLDIICRSIYPISSSQLSKWQQDDLLSTFDAAVGECIHLLLDKEISKEQVVAQGIQLSCDGGTKQRGLIICRKRDE